MRVPQCLSRNRRLAAMRVVSQASSEPLYAKCGRISGEVQRVCMAVADLGLAPNRPVDIRDWSRLALPDHRPD